MILTFIAALIFGLVLINILFWPKVRKAEACDFQSGLVSILIPARNEERNIAQCLEAAREQGPVVHEILVYDDHSTDSTAGVVRAQATLDPRIRLIQPALLPPGWCGKNFACFQLAGEASAKWLLFLDADTRVQRGAVCGMVGEAKARDLTLLSCWPGFDLLGFAERTLMPLLNFIVFTIFPAVLSSVRNEPSLGLAHGACILVDRATYVRLGGHAMVREEIFEDTQLARSWRSQGERSLCLDGQDVVRVRMYSDFGEIWGGFQKNFYPAFRKAGIFWLFLSFQFTAFLLPFLLRNWTASALVIASRLLLAVRFSQPWWSALTHPAGELLLLCLGISSWWRCRSGKGVAWKGRVYRARQV